MATRRIGRPPASADLDPTTDRILLAAREAFSRYGYHTTTLKDIAAATNITTGAIYHHYESKKALFVAVYADAEGKVLAEFEAAAKRQATFADQLCAVFETAARLHGNDPTLARFSAISAIELRRHPELDAAINDGSKSALFNFLSTLAKRAGDRGELPTGLDVSSVSHLLVAMMLGLSQFGAIAESGNAHRKAVRALEHLIRASF
jgi:AcrR family transcriptional regulator